jgi:hypothetical protein
VGVAPEGYYDYLWHHQHGQRHRRCGPALGGTEIAQT